MDLSEIRKAIVAVLTPVLSLPILSVIAGDQAFEWQVFVGAALTGLVTFLVPNKPPSF